MFLNIATQTALFLPVLLGAGSLSIDAGYLQIVQTQSEAAADAAALAGSYTMSHDVVLINESTFPLTIDKIVSTAETCEIEDYEKGEKKPGEKFKIRVKQKKISVQPGAISKSFLEIWFKNPKNEETYCKVEMKRKVINRSDE